MLLFLFLLQTTILAFGSCGSGMMQPTPFCTFFPLVYQKLQIRAFSGRLDFFHKVGRAGGDPGIGIGLAARHLTHQLDHDWWLKFRGDLFESVANAGLPQTARDSEHIQTLGQIRANFPEPLLTVEFEDGFVIAKNGGDEL